MTLSKLARWLYACHYCTRSFVRAEMFNDRCCTACATSRFNQAKGA